MRVTNGAFEALLHFFAAEESLTRQDERVDEIKQSPPMFEFASLTFHRHAIVARRPHRADVGAHAAAGDDIDFDAVFFEDLNDSDVSKTASAAGRKRKPDATMSDLAGQTADIGIEITIRPPAKSLRSGQCRTAVDEAVDRPTHLLQESVEVLLTLLSAGDGSDVDVFPTRMGL